MSLENSYLDFNGLKRFKKNMTEYIDNHSANSIVFHSEEELNEAIENDKIPDGAIVNLTYDYDDELKYYGKTLYYDENSSQLQLKNGNTILSSVIIESGGGASIQLDIETTSDSFVGKTVNVLLNNIVVTTAIFDETKKVSVKLKSYGTYIISVDDDFETIDVTASQLYTVTINESPKATINVSTTTTSFYDKTVTCSKDSETITKTFSDTGTIQFKVKTTGTWTITCEGYSNTVSVTDLTATYNTEIHIPVSTILVNTKESDWYETNVVLKKESTIIETKKFAIDGTCSFMVYETGTYTIETNNKSITVNVIELDKDYSLSINALEIVTWVDGTDEEIAAMLEAHYNGEINLSDYWSVGDIRKASLSPMAATGVGESHEAQEVELVIIDFEHDDLVSGGKAAVTVQQRDSLSEYGYMNSSSTNANGWDGCPRRTWCNNVYKKALPATLASLIKTVAKKASAGNKSSTIKTSNDDVFLVSEVEVFGETTYSFAGEGTQYEYYKTTVNRVKYQGIDRATAKWWWERSPRSSEITEFCDASSSGNAGRSLANNTGSLAPAFCL